eukprot:4409587-Amphidinium_carterae.1
MSSATRMRPTMLSLPRRQFIGAVFTWGSHAQAGKSFSVALKSCQKARILGIGQASAHQERSASMSSLLEQLEDRET